LWHLAEKAVDNGDKEAAEFVWTVGGKQVNVFVVTKEEVNKDANEDEGAASYSADLIVNVFAVYPGAQNGRVRLVEHRIPMMMGTSEIYDMTVRCTTNTENKLVVSLESFDIYSGHMPGFIERFAFAFDAASNKPNQTGHWQADEPSKWAAMPAWAQFGKEAKTADTPPTEWADKLKVFVKNPKGKGTVTRLDGKEYLLLKTPKGPLGFVGLNDLPAPACRTDKRPMRAGTWWFFEGENPVALQLTDTSADFWQYDKDLRCIASRIAFEAAYMEKGAKELLNVRLLYQSVEAAEWKDIARTFANTKYKLSNIALAVKETDKTDLGDVFEHRATWSPDTQSETIRISRKGVTVSPDGVKMTLQHDFDEEADFGDLKDTENYLYRAAQVTVYQNKTGRIFFGITTQNSLWGQEIQSEQGRLFVYGFLPSGNTETTTSDDPSEAETASDDRDLRRYYTTSFGTVEHHVEKHEKTIDCPQEPTADQKNMKCPVKSHRQITQWMYRAVDGMPIFLHGKK
jgi:hypothetical protein